MGSKSFLRKENSLPGGSEEQPGDPGVWSRETAVADKVRDISGTQITLGPVDPLRASAFPLDERGAL